MKKSMFSLAALVTMVTSLSGCSTDDESIQMISRQSLANRVVNDVKYIKDPRTNLCFAYYWGGGAYGGPAIALVPEDSIPPGLLITGQSQK